MQTQGAAMGIHMASSYANRFIRKLDQNFLQTQDRIPPVWWRCIKDVFAIWTHGELSLRTFIDSLNLHHPMIKLTLTWLVKVVVFLDTRVYFANNRIETHLHMKPTGKHHYLAMDLYHPNHCNTAISYSELLHFQIICLEEETLL